MPAPASSDVVAFLSAQCGVTVTTSQVEAQLALAIADASRLTGYRPIVGAEGTKKVMARARVVLPTGLYGDIAVTDFYGSALSLETHYRLWPVEAGASGQPYEWLQWLTPLAPSAPINVTGTWGLADDWPDDLFQAVVNYAAGRTLEAIRQGRIAGEGVSWREADAARDSGGTLGAANESALAGGSLIAAANAVFDNYSRAVVYA